MSIETKGVRAKGKNIGGYKFWYIGRDGNLGQPDPTQESDELSQNDSFYMVWIWPTLTWLVGL